MGPLDQGRIAWEKSRAGHVVHNHVAGMARGEDGGRAMAKEGQPAGCSHESLKGVWLSISKASSTSRHPRKESKMPA